MDPSRMVRFFLTIALLGLAPPVQGGDLPVKLKRQGARIDVFIGGQPFTSYFFGAESPKPYLHPLRSARGTIVTRGFPMRKDIPGESTDHPHHRALFFAHGNINGIDFWSESEPTKAAQTAKGVFYPSEGLPKGRTVLRKLEQARSGRESGTIRALFDLVGPKGEVVARRRPGLHFSWRRRHAGHRLRVYPARHERAGEDGRHEGRNLRHPRGEGARSACRPHG